MGQYWEFVNIDKRQSSELGEFFATRTCEDLIYLLAIPAVPLKNTLSNPATRLQVAGTWAGDRIICLGDYADSWPDGVVTDGDFLQTASDVASEDATERSPQAFTVMQGLRKC